MSRGRGLTAARRRGRRERSRARRGVRVEGRAVVGVLHRLPHHRRRDRGRRRRRARRSRSASSSSSSSRGSWCASLGVLVNRLVAPPERRRREARADSPAGVSFVDTGPMPASARARAAGRDDRRGAAQRRRRSSIWSIAVLTVLAELGVNLAPLLAGAGIAGVALGFGAQSLVRDFLSGAVHAVEDQFGVGDVIDARARDRHRRGREPAHDARCATSTASCGTSPTARSTGSATSRSSGRARSSTSRSRTTPTSTPPPR